ncbi:MAG: hypothetical protein R3F36_15425 [Candidatus Competibacteraceae bacterium]
MVATDGQPSHPDGVNDILTRQRQRHRGHRARDRASKPGIAHRHRAWRAAARSPRSRVLAPALFAVLERGNSE